jgi:Polyketide cyclase / dehydrase and lipid transport
MKAPIEVRNEMAMSAAAERVWDLLTGIGDWPSWYRACQWVRVESTEDAERPVSFRWKAHPIELHSTVIASARPHLFAFVADAPGLHAERTFTIRSAPDGLNTVVVSHETQLGWLPRLGRMFLAPRLRAANQAMFGDLARAAGKGSATRVGQIASNDAGGSK